MHTCMIMYVLCMVCVCVRARARVGVFVCVSLAHSLSLCITKARVVRLKKICTSLIRQGLFTFNNITPLFCYRRASPTLHHPEVCVYAYPGR
jgi:hypothetical protein